jgi:RluA family pseudouridine synthase
LKGFQVARFIVTTRDTGKRLDFFLKERLGISRKDAKGLIDAGLVRVGGKKVFIAKWKVVEEDVVVVDTEGKTAKGGAYGHVDVIYSDRDILVVNKPAGVAVQKGKRREITYVDIVRGYLKRRYRARGSYAVPLHRLDRETSGAMVFALSKAGAGLVSKFKNHEVGREYLAVVCGRVKEDGLVDAPILKGDFGFGRKAGIREEGERAVTIYKVKERYKNATLLLLELKTGRTHQARVHMASIGHPIVGDKIYGKEGGISFGRCALHSYAISFKHPTTGEVVRFEAELPGDMAELIDSLRTGV